MCQIRFATNLRKTLQKSSLGAKVVLSLELAPRGKIKANIDSSWQGKGGTHAPAFSSCTVNYSFI
jgi:hypothetical protein